MAVYEKQPKVLIIDDIAENRKLLAALIQENTDYSIILASNGKTVLKSINNLNPDLILLDIMMPDIDGYEVAIKIKQNERFLHVPILFLTAVSDTEGILKGFRSGGVDYISKPFNQEVLLARVKTHIELKIMRDELEIKNSLLEDRELHLGNEVEKKTRQVEDAALALVSAIENANLFNDTDTGNHIKNY